MMRRLPVVLLVTLLASVADAQSAGSAVAKGKAAGAAPAPAKGPATAPAIALVDLNTATPAQLEAVPGIGKAYAAKILAGRPWANKLQLLQRKVLPPAAYEKAKAHIVARQPSS